MATKKPVTKAATTRRTTTTRRRAAKPTPTHDHIAERAYYLHLEHGGDAFENWLLAERELAA